jgi:hypothetical protein
MRVEGRMAKSRRPDEWHESTLHRTRPELNPTVLAFSRVGEEVGVGGVAGVAGVVDAVGEGADGAVVHCLWELHLLEVYEGGGGGVVDVGGAVGVGVDVGGVEAGHRSHLQLAAGGMMVKLRVLRCRR